jgi:hypothetical protein
MRVGRGERAAIEKWALRQMSKSLRTLCAPLSISAIVPLMLSMGSA